MSTSSRQHGQPAENKPDSAIPTHRPNTQKAKPIQGPKLYSKVLAIEPNRLLSKCSELNKGVDCSFVHRLVTRRLPDEILTQN
jgi:hypothetical protein